MIATSNNQRCFMLRGRELRTHKLSHENSTKQNNSVKGNLSADIHTRKAIIGMGWQKLLNNRTTIFKFRKCRCTMKKSELLFMLLSCFFDDAMQYRQITA